MDLFWFHTYRKIMQETGGFSVFMYGQSEFTVDINFLSAENMDTIEMRMFPEKCGWKTT